MLQVDQTPKRHFQETKPNKGWIQATIPSNLDLLKSGVMRKTWLSPVNPKHLSLSVGVREKLCFQLKLAV